jgi:hypothetical protein
MISFNGTKGRLEHNIVEQTHSSGTNQAQATNDSVFTRIIPLRGSAKKITPAEGQDGNGSGDPVMLDAIFQDPRLDILQRASDERDGANATLVGVAANESFVSRKTVFINDLIKGRTRPALTPMPSRSDPVPMPKK